MKGEARWEEREGGVARGPLIAGKEGTAGRVVETEGEPMELLPGGDRVLGRPVVIGRSVTVAATVRGGVGLAGGVVSIPLSSIIFSALFLHFGPDYTGQVANKVFN